MHARSNNLAKMANQISAFFESQSGDDVDTAAREVAGHLKLLWAPSMLEDLIAQFDRGEADVLTPAVVVALRDHRAVLLGIGGHAPAEREAFPEGGGDAG